MTTNLIDSAVNQFMEKEALRAKIPSIFAKNPHARASKRYSFVDSEEVIDTLLNNGFGIVRANGVNVRKVDNIEHCRHVIAFRPNNYNELKIEDPRKVGTPMFPEVILSNSSDCKSMIELNMGIYTLVCSNGLVTGRAFGGFRAKHTNIDMQAFKKYLEGFYTMSENLVETIKRWQSIQMTEMQRLELASTGAVIRWSEEKAANIPPANLLAYHRAADVGTDLWTTFNVVQENLMKGGFATNGKHKTARKIESAIKEWDVNQQLWDVAEGYAR